MSSIRDIVKVLTDEQLKQAIVELAQLDDDSISPLPGSVLRQLVSEVEAQGLTQEDAVGRVRYALHHAAARRWAGIEE